MSGGHFDYIQYRFEEIAEEVRVCAFRGRGEYSAETLARFEECAQTVKRAGDMLQRVDWLVSGDDGEETFHERWAVEIENNSVRG